MGRQFSSRRSKAALRAPNVPSQPLKKQEVRARVLPLSRAKTFEVTVMGQAEGFTRSALICADLPSP